MMFTQPKKLLRKGIIGMNARNASYIARYNTRALYPLVDDKYETKRLAREFEVPAPELYGLIRYQHQLKGLEKMLQPHSQFVVKPSQGSAGKGILVITGRDGDDFLKPSGDRVSLQEIKRHISNTLSGLYSLGGRNDKALIEYAIQFTDAFNDFSFQGVPDVRVIIFKGFPVMAMMRLSTQVSDGKANLHQGAVGVGIDLASGRALKAVQFNRPILDHPDTGRALNELEVPHWDELLLLAAKSYEMTELGYLGADIVIDRELGPMMLELNARPGLAIQVANGLGLKPRLEGLETMGKKTERMSPEERVAYAQNTICKMGATE